MVMVLFAFPLTVNAEDGEQVVENLVDEENIKNEEQEIPVIPEISTNDSVSDEEQVDEEGVDFFNGASARIAGTWIHRMRMAGGIDMKMVVTRRTIGKILTEHGFISMQMVTCIPDGCSKEMLGIIFGIMDLWRRRGQTSMALGTTLTQIQV